MEINILITGVGGQGTVLTSRILAQTAIDQGFFASTAETIGMAQRGGCVTSHVRIGAEGNSPTIPLGSADLIIAFEPAEACRCACFLKKGGSMIVNTKTVVPATCAQGKEYPLDEIMDYLKQIDANVVFADGTDLCRQAGSYKVLNTVMLGVALCHDMLPFQRAELENTIYHHLPKKVQEMNITAMSLGGEKTC